MKINAKLVHELKKPKNSWTQEETGYLRSGL